MSVTLAVCSLRQQALDYFGNRDRIIESILRAKRGGARFRVGPELEVTGYGCWDHFLENDIYLHAWQMLADIIKSGVTNGILCDIGMPIVHRNVRYNCRIVLLNGQLVLIRPKMVLANSGNYHESRWFASWPRGRVEEFYLPRMIRDLTNQSTIPIGEAVISTLDTCIGFEICEELFVSNSPHVTMSLAGVEIFSNGSASYHEIGKLNKKVKLLQTSMDKSGGIYLYSNALGSDGDRVYYDGASFIVANGDLVSTGGLFSFQDVITSLATIDLEEVRTFRGTRQSMANQGKYPIEYSRITVDFALNQWPRDLKSISKPIGWEDICPHEEMATAPALWLLDYLILSGAPGFFVPLSGGLDSTCVAMIVFRLACILSAEHKKDSPKMIELLGKIPLNLTEYTPQEICHRLLTTCYMSTNHSTSQSKALAESLATEIGSNHMSLSINSVVSAAIELMSSVLNFAPTYQSHGGTRNEDVALQNIQARLRMVLSYALAQLYPVGNASRPLLVLATSNASEILSGYFTKYDNSSGDLNPIGSYSKQELRGLIKFMRDLEPDSTLSRIMSKVLDATPSAELTPEPQTDEEAMGMAYDDLSLMGFLRIAKRCGPYSMLSRLDQLREHQDSCSMVQKFHQRYQNNRHKAASLPPTFHGSSNSPDDSRFDLRPLVYPRDWLSNVFSHGDRGGVCSLNIPE